MMVKFEIDNYGIATLYIDGCYMGQVSRYSGIELLEVFNNFMIEKKLPYRMHSDYSFVAELLDVENEALESPERQRLRNSLESLKQEFHQDLKQRDTGIDSVKKSERYKAFLQMKRERQEERQKRFDDYYKNPILCLRCKTPLNICAADEGWEFCSLSCLVIGTISQFFGKKYFREERR